MMSAMKTFKVGDRVKYIGKGNESGTISKSQGTVAKVRGRSINVIHDTAVNCYPGGRTHRCWSSSVDEFASLGERVEECFWEQLPILYEDYMHKELSPED